jgi:hypothetical protein
VRSPASGVVRSSSVRAGAASSFDALRRRRRRLYSGRVKKPASIAFEIDRYLERIRAFEGERFEVVEQTRIGSLPILSVRSRGVATKTLLVLAGIHGDERAGLLAVPSILERWSAGDVRLVVITPVNPVGAARQTRANGNGQDINRDFVRFATAEARVVRDAFESLRPDFVISLHEGPQRGTFMFANECVDLALAASLCDALEAGGTVLATRDYFGMPLRPPGLSPASATTRAVWRLWARAFRSKASIVYSQDRAIPELVLESSWWNPDEEARVRPHVNLVLAVAQALGPHAVR